MKRECLALLLSLSGVATIANAQSGSASALPPVPVPVSAAPAAFSPMPAGTVPAAASSGAYQGADSPALLPPPVPLSPPLAGGVVDVPPAPPGPPIAIPESGWHSPFFFESDGGNHLWVTTDFLLFFVKNGPLNVPLATTGSSSDANPGALGQAHTQVLYGLSSLNYGAFAGGDFEIGGWFDEESRFGMEGGFFFLGQKNTGYGVFSDNTGSPVLSVPIINAQTKQEDQVPVASPGVYAGGVVVSSSSELEGADLKVDFNLIRSNGFHLDALAGFRFLDLREDFNLQTPDVSLASSSQGSGYSYNTIDDFHTSNQFYGGLLGTRLGYTRDRLSIDLMASVSLGSTYQSMNVDGVGIATPPGGQPQFSSGGIFAQPTNMGHYWAWDFTVVPEAQLKFGYRVWRNMQITAGYDFLYWSSVVRPGAQIDRTVNLSQSSLLSTGTLSGPAQPVVPYTRSDFFAHGLTIGLDFRW